MSGFLCLSDNLCEKNMVGEGGGTRGMVGEGGGRLGPNPKKVGGWGGLGELRTKYFKIFVLFCRYKGVILILE